MIKCSSKMFQNLPHFWNTKPHVVLFIFHFVLLYFSANECPGLWNEKKLRGFSYSKIMANFEAFRWNISSIINPLFMWKIAFQLTSKWDKWQHYFHQKTVHKIRQKHKIHSNENILLRPDQVCEYPYVYLKCGFY